MRRFPGHTPSFSRGERFGGGQPIFEAVSRLLTKIAPYAWPLLVFRIAFGGFDGRHRLTESHHNGNLRHCGNLIIHTSHPLRAQDSAGRRSINWLHLLDHGNGICQAWQRSPAERRVASAQVNLRRSAVDTSKTVVARAWISVNLALMVPA